MTGSEGRGDRSGPDVLGPAETLAHIIHEDPQALDKETYRQGDQFLVLFTDSNFGPNIKNLSKLKIGLIKQAIEDLSNRGRVLSQAYIGLTFFENQPTPFLSQYSETPSGNVIFKIGIKNTAAFLNWRQGEGTEITQDDINAGIYRLTAEWAHCL